MAAAHGNEEIVALLLSLGARVDIANDAGLTALHKACQYNSPAACGALR